MHALIRSLQGTVLTFGVQAARYKKKRFARNMPIQDHANRIALLDLNFDMPLAPAY